MMLSIPSVLDTLVPTGQYENTQIEVTLDDDMGIVSILVMSEETVVQSVIAVPMQNKGKWKRMLLKSRLASKDDNQGHAEYFYSPLASKENSGGDISSSKKQLATPPRTGRKADFLRPTSPIPHNRSSVFERHTARRRIRDAQSCPPPRLRQQHLYPDDSMVKPLQTSTIRPSRPEDAKPNLRSRDISCPPKLRNTAFQEPLFVPKRRPSTTASPKAPRQSSRVSKNVTAGGKPNLVSMTSAKKNIILRSIRTGRSKKVAPVLSVM